uniref:Uncharacterized protein n=1 Tax=viral metagenome TaxID=1070528 RepID=A0A6M3KJL8_9ZZZZ
MARFWGDHPGTMQTRGRRNIKPATREERLESMRRELANREKSLGTGHWMTEEQRQVIAQEEAK